jgi:UDP-MurNAc hydroxylase
MEDRLLLLNSGQSFDLSSDSKEPNVPFKEHTEEDRERYVSEHISKHAYDHELVTFGPSVSISRLVGHARKRLWDAQTQRQTFPAMHLVLDFDSSRQRFEIDLTSDKVTALDINKPLNEPYLRMSGSDTLMIMILIGHISWNIADAALFLDYERRPNIYDPSIYVLLNFLKL